jgi:hypothetical protein
VPQRDSEDDHLATRSGVLRGDGAQNNDTFQVLFQDPLEGKEPNVMCAIVGYTKRMGLRKAMIWGSCEENMKYTVACRPVVK